MKSFKVTLFALLTLFFAIMVVVAVTALRFSSKRTALDTSKMAELRQQTSQQTTPL